METTRSNFVALLLSEARIIKEGRRPSLSRPGRRVRAVCNIWVKSEQPTRFLRAAFAQQTSFIVTSPDLGTSAREAFLFFSGISQPFPPKTPVQRSPTPDGSNPGMSRLSPPHSRSPFPSPVPILQSSRAAVPRADHQLSSFFPPRKTPTNPLLCFQLIKHLSELN